MGNRFFVSQPLTAGESVELPPQEAQHLIRVLRGRTGDRVTLFDGGGAEFAAQIQKVDRQRVEVQVLERRDVDRELPVSLTLCVALPKGERQKWLVEKAVELGVDRVIPLQTTHGVAQPSDGAMERMRRTVIEASKQSGRNRLMEIVAPRSAAQLFADRYAPGIVRWVAHPQAKGGSRRPELAPDVRQLVFAIGPEGGFSDDEAAAAHRGGWKLVGLGARILRVETAAMALAAWASLSLARVE